ncbi:ras and Rab interactor 2-like [Hemiscyllium ocellatum]|uniref:ras and Rab interactor 2-like n=1 Tax=Hemiscyllium ocellatum TaxID=170820 RepID=UPI002965E61B|nr:ras and Rab interactor 2-like [Hemiscyllium ocellatum]
MESRVFYRKISLLCLQVIHDEKVYWWEALSLALLYVAYIVVMKYNLRIRCYFEGLRCAGGTQSREEQEGTQQQDSTPTRIVLYSGPEARENSVLMVDELFSASPHKLSFPEASLRIMITRHFSPRTRLSMASRMLINERQRWLRAGAGVPDPHVTLSVPGKGAMENGTGANAAAEPSPGAGLPESEETAIPGETVGGERKEGAERTGPLRPFTVPGTGSNTEQIFLVRQSVTSQKKLLSVRLPDDCDPSFVHDFTINEDSGNTTFSLEGSGMTFGDLFHLISFYCVSRDILPFTLKLPLAITSARSHKILKTISHLGIEFWTSALNVRERPPSGVEECGVAPPQETGSPQPADHPRLSLHGPLRTRGPGEVGQTSQSGALSFVNPLFEGRCKGRRGHFKSSFKVRVSTETSSPLSPPSEPPPPVPCQEEEGEGEEDGSGAAPQLEGEGVYQRPRTPVPPPRLKKRLKTWAVRSEEGYRVPLPSCPSPPTSPLEEGGGEGWGGGGDRLSDSNSSEGLELLRGGNLPQIGEVDSQSLSREGEMEGERRQARPQPDQPPSAPRPPPRSRGARWDVRAPLRRVLSSFAGPEWRLVHSVQEQARDSGTSVGALVQGFMGRLRDGSGVSGSRCSTELLQDIRAFMTHTKSFLRQSMELELPSDSLLQEAERDRLLEVAMHKSILKPLKGRIEATLREYHIANGSLQQLRANMQLVRQAGPQSLGLRFSNPDPAALDKIKHKFILMQKMYSPLKKVQLLLQAMKLICNRVKAAEGQHYGADEFLPSLSYTIAECELPELSLEVEYMMELLDQTDLTGEGGYYLTSLYASMFELQNFHVHRVMGGISNEVRHSLKQWHHRRKTNEPMPSINDFQNFLRVAYHDPDNGCTAKTLVVRPQESVEDVCRLCARKFKVQSPAEHGLFLVVDDDWRLLPPDSHPQQLKAGLQAREASGCYHFVYKPIGPGRSMVGARAKLIRDNAIDLGGDLELRDSTGPDPGSQA